MVVARDLPLHALCISLSRELMSVQSVVFDLLTENHSIVKFQLEMSQNLIALGRSKFKSGNSQLRTCSQFEDILSLRIRTDFYLLFHTHRSRPVHFHIRSETDYRDSWQPPGDSSGAVCIEKCFRVHEKP